MSKQIQEAYIVAATRLPVGKRNGMFRNARPDDMLAHAIRAVVAQAPGVDPTRIGDVIVGCAIPEAEQGMNVARIGALLAGLPNTVPGITINRFCSSGLQAVADAANQIRLGLADVMIAAGTESMTAMSNIMGNKVAANPAWFSDENIGIAYGMGLTAEKVAQQWGIGREAQDAFAEASHRKACAAIAAGHFKAETSPFTVRDYKPDLASGEIRQRDRTPTDDEGARPDISVEKLARLRPVFHAKGSVTAGNASQMSDGAGAVMLVSEKVLKEHNLTPLARFAGFAVGGVAPEIMGVGPIVAIPKVLQQAGIRKEDLDWIELNEAFAAQALAVVKELDLDPSKINPLGGAIALGHPLGATGAIRSATVVHALRRRNLKYGMVTMCVGMGQGAAGILERV